MKIRILKSSLACILLLILFSPLFGVSTGGKKTVSKSKAIEISWQKKYEALKLEYDKREKILNELMGKRFGKKWTKAIKEVNATIKTETLPTDKEKAEGEVLVADIAQLRIFLGQQLPGKKLGKASKYNQQVSQITFELEKIQDAKDIEDIKHIILTFYNQALAKLTSKRAATFNALQKAMIALKLIEIKTLYPTYIAKVNAIIRQEVNDNNVNLLKPLIEKLPDEEINKIGKFKIFQYIKRVQKNSSLALLPTTQELIQVAQKKGIMPK